MVRLQDNTIRCLAFRWSPCETFFFFFCCEKVWKTKTVKPDECQTDQKTMRNGLMLMWLLCLSQLPNLINIKNRCCRWEMKHDSATARPLLHLCVFRNWVWHLIEESFFFLFFNISTTATIIFQFKNGKPDLIPADGGFFFFFSTQEQEGMSERCKILVCPYIPANLKISKTGFSPKYNGTNPISESHIYWRSLFRVSTVTKKAKFDKKTKQNSDWQLTTRWQRPCFLNTFESPAKARAAIRSFSDYRCANLPPRWLRLCWRSHRVHQQTQRNGCTNTPTYTYLPTPITLAWQTQRKK